jgi:hypothetical protein
MYTDHHVKSPLFSSDFNETWLLSTDSNALKQHFIEFLPLGAELLRADGRTDMTKLIVAVFNFSKEAKWRKMAKLSLLSS